MTSFNLEKETQTVKFMLEKQGITSIEAEVIGAVDLSGSTRGIYGNGDMQEAIQRLVPVALNFDDNGDIPVYGFNAKSDSSPVVVLPSLTAKSFAGYTNREILNKNIDKWGGTDYSPVIRQALRDLGFLRSGVTGAPAPRKASFLSRMTGGLLGDSGQLAITPTSSDRDEKMFPTSNSGLPSLFYMLTDGGCSAGDEKPTEDLLWQCANAKAPIYFNFVGVGHDSFSFLKQLADDLPNAEFTQILDLAKVGDDIYNHLLPAELMVWLKPFMKVS